jgi:hypothetical protein
MRELAALPGVGCGTLTGERWAWASGLVGVVTLHCSGGPWWGRAPVVEGTAHHGILAGLQHDVTVHELFDSPFTVGQEAAQAQAATTAKGGPEHQDAQVQ